MIRRSLRGSLAAVLGLLVALPALAQSEASERYLNHQELSSAVRELASQYPNLASVDALSRSDGGRELWTLTLGRGSTEELGSRPALLVVANLEGNHLIGSSAALYLARHLAEGYGEDEEITRLLDERTVYVMPRINPDGAELVWAMPGYELPYKPHPDAPELGGMNIREIGTDLNGDGMVTLMRVRDPEGTLIPDPEEPRLLREADRARAERGLYRIYVEGIDPEDEDAYVPMGSDGVNLNRNFPHEYLYYQPHVGPHQVSEVETRALADFMFEQVNVAAVLTFSPYDNLRSLPSENRRPPEGVAPGPPSIPSNILAQDRPFYRYISERFAEITDLRGDGEADEAGSFPQFAYFQVGVPSFTTPVWSPEPMVAMGGGGGSSGGSAAAGSGGRDAQWLAHLDDAGTVGFIDWEEAEHPTLGTVEVGGFVPNARVNPPEEQIGDLARRHAEFAVWLGNQLPAIEIVETSVEARGDHVYRVTATIANEQYLPTHLQMGTRVRTNRPITIRLAPNDAVTVLSGNIQQQIQRLEGMGDRRTFTWLVQAAPGTPVSVEVFAERAGGLQSTNLTLR
jgi:hypothetical protein